MRRRGFSETALLATAVLCAALAARADVGGGKGLPATPWPVAPPKDAEEVEKARVEAAKHQTLSVPAHLLSAERTGLAHLQGVALGVEDEEDEEDEGARSYALVGKGPSGETTTLSFAQIESFLVKSRKEGKMV